MHGAHVPLCGGPGAYAEGHGRSRSQQVSCSYCFKLLNWSRLLWSVQQVSPVWCTREVCSTQIACYWFPSSAPGFSRTLAATAVLPTTHVLWGTGSHGQPGPPHRKTSPVSCSSQCHPARPFPLGAGLSFGFYMFFFLFLNNEFSIPHHGPTWSLHRSLQPSGLLCAPTSKERSGDGVDRAGPASCHSLHVVASSVTTLVSSWLLWCNPNLGRGQGLQLQGAS